METVQLTFGEAILIHGLGGEFAVLQAFQKIGRAHIRAAPHGGEELLNHVLNQICPVNTNLGDGLLLLLQKRKDAIDWLSIGLLEKRQQTTVA